MAGYIGKVPVPQATQTRDSFIATASQTTFTTSGYTPGYIDVFLNGVHLDPSDYTATNGSDVVLDSAAAENDVVNVVAYSTFVIENGTFSNGITVDNDGATVATFDRATSDGAIVDLQKDGSSVGEIGSDGGDSTYIELRSNSGIRGGSASVHAYYGGADRDGLVDLGRSGVRWKDLYLSGGIYFGSETSDKLDVYEEGTWTPAISGVTTSGSYTASVAEGYYRRISDLVYVQWLIVVTAVATQPTGNIELTGLPYNSVSNNYDNVLNIMYNDTFNNNYRGMFARTGGNALMRPIGVTQGNANWTGDTLTTGYFSGAGFYRAS